uniref:ABC transporter domain-containing protein n=1 Tax=Acrobeloides nanus TaxID=290746 RepID=A0A914EDH7_9BILA
MHSYDGSKDIATIISNNAFVYIYLINSFTRMTDVASTAGEMSGILQRIADFVRWPSGSGKSSLLRILSCLWNPKQGIIRRNIGSNDVLCIPQRVYFPTGNLSLRQQICFPCTISNNFASEDTAQIENILKTLKLDSLLVRCGGLDNLIDFEWKETLTPGELQRLSFARVVYQKPKLVILDEATNSLPNDMEATIYRLLKTNEIQYISAGHRDSLRKLHDLELKLDGKTGYNILEIIN